MPAERPYRITWEIIGDQVEIRFEPVPFRWEWDRERADDVIARMTRAFQDDLATAAAEARAALRARGSEPRTES